MTAVRGRARPCARATRPDASERERRETYLIPGPAAQQGLIAARELLGLRPQLILDLGTGPGVLLQQAGVVWPGAERVGVEIRSEESAAARHCDRWICGDYLSPATRLPPADLVVTNPPFSHTVATVDLALDRLLRPRGRLLLFARKTWGESAAASDLLRRRPPSHNWQVHRRLGMAEGEDGEGDAGTDTCNHVWWVFRPGDAGREPSWTTRTLPPLPASMCTWTVRPGEELTPPALLDSAYWPRK